MRAVTTQASPAIQRERLVMLVRGLAAYATRNHARSGETQGMLIKQIVAQGVKRITKQLAAMSDVQTLSLMRFCERMLPAVSDSGSDDESFVAEFHSAYFAVECAFGDEPDAESTGSEPPDGDAA